MNESTKHRRIGGQPRFAFHQVGAGDMRWRGLSALTMLAGCSVAYAGPEGGAVVQGQATIDRSGAGHTNITQVTDRAVINWQSFDIEPGESINFDQPSAHAAVLNRVLGSDPTVIAGLLSADGYVYLVNSSGVLFSDSAQVDVSGLIATTADISDENFMAGRYRFNAAGDPSAAVANRGRITARDQGLVALVGPGVENSGVISARLGRVVLASGETFTLDLYGDGLVTLPVGQELLEEIYTADGKRLSSAIDMSGRIEADGGHVLLSASTAARALNSLVNVEGVIRARTDAKPGDIVILAGQGRVDLSGTVDASGSTGGSVKVSGTDVNVGSAAFVDVSGDSGGGIALIGGEVGGGPGLSAASFTTISSGARIDASASIAGDGGTVVVWADDTTVFEGMIRAEGGSASGNGGFIEVSGKRALKFLGEVLGGAVNGEGGTLLLDPENITITSGGSENLAESTIRGDAISAILRNGIEVVLTADQNIDINDVIDGRGGEESGAALVLTAGNAIRINSGTGVSTADGSITMTAGSGGITMDANAYLFVAAADSPTDIGVESISLTADGSVTTGQLITLGAVQVSSTASNVDMLAGLFGLAADDGVSGIGSLDVRAGGAVDLRGVLAHEDVTVQANGRVTNRGSSITARDGNVLINAGSGGIALEALTDGASGVEVGSTAGTVALLADGAVTLNSSVLTQGGDIAVGSAARRAASITMADGSVLQAVGSADSTDQDGSVSLHAVNDIVAEALVVGSRGAVVVDASAGKVTLNEGLFGVEDPSNSDEGPGIGSLTIQAGGAVDMQGVLAHKDVTVQANGTITNRGRSITSRDGNVLIDAGSGGIALEALTGGASGVEVRSAAGTVTLLGGGAVTLNSSLLTQGGDIAVGSAARRAASITMADGSVLQALGSADSADQDGSVSLHAVNDIVAEALVVGSSGAVVVDASAGKVTLNTGLFGVEDPNNSEEGPGIGSLTVLAGGAVDMQGVLAGADVTVQANGTVTNRGSSITARDGSVFIDAGSGGIALEALTGGAAGVEVRNAAGTVTLLGSGAAILNSSVLTQGGDIAVGSAARRAASITMAEGSVLQAVASAGAAQQGGSVLLHALNAISTQGLVSGRQGTIRIDSSNGPVTLQQGVFGIDDGSEEGAGVGGLAVIAGSGGAMLNGALVNGGVLLDPARPDAALIVDSGAGITVNPAGGSTTALITETGNIELTALGDILIGEQSGELDTNFGLIAGRNGDVDAGVVILADGSSDRNLLLESGILTHGGGISLGRRLGAELSDYSRAPNRLLTSRNAALQVIRSDELPGSTIQVAARNDASLGYVITNGNFLALSEQGSLHIGAPIRGVPADDDETTSAREVNLLAAKQALFNGAQSAGDVRVNAGYITVLGPVDAGGGVYLHPNSPVTPDVKISLNSNVRATGPIEFGGDVTIFGGPFAFDEQSQAWFLSGIGLDHIKDTDNDGAYEVFYTLDGEELELWASEANDLFRAAEEIAAANLSLDRQCSNLEGICSAPIDTDLFTGIDSLCFEGSCGFDEDGRLTSTSRYDTFVLTQDNFFDIEGNLAVPGLTTARALELLAANGLGLLNYTEPDGNAASYQAMPGEKEYANERIALLKKLLGSLQLTIQSDGDISFSATLDRYANTSTLDEYIEQIPLIINKFEDYPSGDLNGVDSIVFPTFVNHSLVVRSGGVITFDGTVGDARAIIGDPDSFNPDDPSETIGGYSFTVGKNDSRSMVLPVLGSFSLQLPDIANTDEVVFNKGFYLNGLVVGGETVNFAVLQPGDAGIGAHLGNGEGVLGVVNAVACDGSGTDCSNWSERDWLEGSVGLGLRLNFAGTTYNTPPDRGTARSPIGGPGFSAGLQRAGAGIDFTDGSVNGGGVRTAGSSSGFGVSASPGIVGAGFVARLPDPPQPPEDNTVSLLRTPSALNETSRDEESPGADSVEEAAGQGACGQGPGQIADVGITPQYVGAAPDVFEACSEDFSSGSAG